MLAQIPEDIFLPIHSPVNVDSLARGQEETETSVPANEEVEPEQRVDTMTEERTIEGQSSEDKYSTLVQSEITPPRPHDYETINLSIGLQELSNEPIYYGRERMADYVNMLSS